MNLNGFEISESNVFGIKQGDTTSTCPECSEHRKPENRKAKCMSVFWDTGLGQCNHCGVRVQLHKYKKKNETKDYKLPPLKARTVALGDTLVGYCKDVRGISESSLKRLKIGESKRWMPKAKSEIQVIEFPYIVFGKVVNVKYRGKNKDFMFEPGCEMVMYNLDSIAHEKECVIVEGEFDVAAFVEAGIENVTSVPNGFTLPKKDGTNSVNLSFIDDYYSFFEGKNKIYLAVDNDVAGKNGQAELIRRFGSEKCWLVDFVDCKDANEYLLKNGKEALSMVLATAKQVPIDYVETISDYRQELHDFWLNGSPKGYTCGIKNLDKIYSTELGQYTIITAPPGAGKSELTDAICLGYAMKYGFKTAFASPENKPNKLHTDKIIRKIAGYKPSTQEQIDSSRIKRADKFYEEHFYHVEFNDGYELSKVLVKFEELVKRKGVRVFVLDPYNKIKLKSAIGKNINDYTAEYMNTIDVFCKKNQCLLILVMHPNKMQKVEGTSTYILPDAYDIKGGGEVFDMGYHIIGLVKDVERKLIKLKTLKIKFQHLGTPDETTWLGWNINNGRYVSVDFSEETGILPEIDWDNGDWLISTEPEELPEKKPNVLDQASKRIMFQNKEIELEEMPF